MTAKQRSGERLEAARHEICSRKAKLFCVEEVPSALWIRAEGKQELAEMAGEGTEDDRELENRGGKNKPVGRKVKNDREIRA